MDKKFLSHFTSLLFSNFFVQGLRFLTIIVLARNLGQSEFGQYNYILLLLGLSAILVEFGLKNYGIREFSQGRGSWNLAKKIIQIRLTISLFTVLLVLGLSYQAFRQTQILLPTFLFALSLIVDAFFVDFVIISEERLHLLAGAQVLQAFFYFVSTYLLMQKSLWLAPLGLIFTLSHVLWVGTYYFKSKTLYKTGPSVLSFSIIKGGLPFLIATFLATFFYQMDVFLLGQFHFDFLLGDYSACLKLLSIPIGVVSSFVGSIQPRLARVSHNREETLKILHSNVKYFVLFSLVMVMTFWIFGSQIIQLFFGNKFLLAPFYIGPLSLVTAAFIIGLLPLHALSVSHNTKALLKMSVFNFILGATLITALLSLKKPELLPWGMLFVQITYSALAWRQYLKK